MLSGCHHNSHPRQQSEVDDVTNDSNRDITHQSSGANRRISITSVDRLSPPTALRRSNSARHGCIYPGLVSAQKSHLKDMGGSLGRELSPPSSPFGQNSVGGDDGSLANFLGLSSSRDGDESPFVQFIPPTGDGDDSVGSDSFLQFLSIADSAPSPTGGDPLQILPFPPPLPKKKEDEDPKALTMMESLKEFIATNVLPSEKSSCGDSSDIETPPFPSSENNASSDSNKSEPSPVSSKSGTSPEALDSSDSPSDSYQTSLATKTNSSSKYSDSSIGMGTPPRTDPSLDSSASTLVGQYLIGTPSRRNLLRDEEASLAYSEASFNDESSEVLTGLNDSTARSTTSRTSSCGSIEIVNTSGSTSSSTSKSQSKDSKQKRRSSHGKRSGRRESYDGAMLQLVDQMHGSGNSMEDFHESKTSLASHFSAGRRSSQRLSVGDDGPCLDPTRSIDYISSESGSTIDDEEPVMSFVDKRHDKGQRRHSSGLVHTKQGLKAHRRGSLSSSSTEGGRKPHNVEKENTKQSRRHSIGSLPTNKSPKEPTRRSSGTTSSHSKGQQGKTSTSKRRCSLKACTKIPKIDQLDRRGSGCVSTRSSESGSISSMSTISSTSDETKELIARLDGTTTVQVAPRGCRTASPGRTRTLKLDDLANMRSSAPVRLDRVRSQRRRLVLLSKQQQEIQNSTSQKKSFLERLSISKLIDHLSIEDLEELNQSSPSLPPLHPSPPSSPSSGRRKCSSVELLPVDPKARTVRTCNRTIDKMYGSIPRPERLSANCSPWQKARRSVGMLPFSSSSSSGSSTTSSSSLEGSMGYDFNSSANLSLASGGTASPPHRSPRRRQSIESVSSSSVSSVSNTTSRKNSNGSNGEAAHPPQLSMINSVASGASEATYALKPFKLEIPDSPPEMMSSKQQRHRRSWQGSANSNNHEDESSSSHSSSSSSSSDDGLAQHARSVDMGVKKTHTRRRASSRRATSPPSSPPPTPKNNVIFDSSSPSPIWKKLESEKNRQQKLRARLHAARREFGSSSPSGGEPRTTVKVY